MDKNTPYDAPLQGNNRSYDTGIRTTDIRQTKFGSRKWQTVSGGFRMYLHNISLIYSKMLRIIQDDNIRIIKKNSLSTPQGGRYTFPLKVPDAVGIIKQPFGCFMFLYPLC